MNPVSAANTAQTVTPYAYGYPIKAYQARAKLYLEIGYRIRRLEPVISALERDSDPRNRVLASVLREHCSRFKKVSQELLNPEMTHYNLLTNEHKKTFTGEKPDSIAFEQIKKDAEIDLSKKVSDFLDTF